MLNSATVGDFDGPADLQSVVFAGQYTLLDNGSGVLFDLTPNDGVYKMAINTTFSDDN
ncbi:MAG TPA: hypothetical protein PLG34_06605 [Spirochaetota bacterium]|nr:hypothetical protein [Spirochaetota bacterium]HPY87634.1 hypothetical protein [Spirochaetota bacterium]HQB61103.1 hypothetical protein [Spirochaetota bacterium]